MTRHAQLLVKLQAVQDILVDRATGEPADEEEYKTLRRSLLQDPLVRDQVPQLVLESRDLWQFWGHVRSIKTYQERREAIWADFRPLLDALERSTHSPIEPPIDQVLSNFSTGEIHRVWHRALERLVDDPEGAITSARTLLETVCKHLLDELNVIYGDKDDLPKLYRAVAKEMNLSPAAHSENIFRQILGGCQSVVEGLGALRNRYSDAHGKGRGQPRPSARHAELAVNLAGAASIFLIQTWEERVKQHA